MNRKPNEDLDEGRATRSGEALRSGPAVEALQSRLEEISRQARDISRLLPRAMSMSSRDSGLAEAMVPAVERALTLSGRSQSGPLADALSPVIGRSMRRALLRATGRAVLSLNRFLLRYASWQGVAWRREARREGLSFEEIADRHTSTSPVRQLFLIHRETGLLLQEMRCESETSQDWDMVAGMLTAIQDFVHDSFNTAPDESVDAIRVGRLNVVIEQGPWAALAGLVHDRVTEELRGQFRETIDRIHTDFAAELQDFDGRTEVFDRSRPHLEAVLRTLVSRERVRILPQTWLALGVPALGAAVLLTLGIRDGMRWRAFITSLADHPGLVVVSEGRRGLGFHVTGLRDPMAPDPEELMRASGVDPKHVAARWEPYQGMSSYLILQRARRLLDPPASIQLSVDQGVLTLEGQATAAWIEKAVRLLDGWSAVGRYDVSGLKVVDSDKEARWNAYLDKLSAEPGIVVLRTGRRRDRFQVVGLRDPLSRNTAELRAEAGLANDDVLETWEPYQALHPALALARARQILEPPPTVSLQLRDGILVAEGEASYAWITRARTLARSIAGVNSFQTDRLVDNDLREVNALKYEIEQNIFRFLVGSPDMWPGQEAKLDRLIEQVRRLQASAARRQLNFVVEIRGHAEPSGDSRLDLTVSESVARTFYEVLQARRVDMRLFAMQGVGSRPPPVKQDESEGKHNRLVSFRVVLLEDSASDRVSR